MRTFTFKSAINKDWTVECKDEKTRYGFRHLASLRKNGCEIAKDKACYYNRTWERYTFESVMHNVLRKAFGNSVLPAIFEQVDKQGLGQDMAIFQAVGMAASLGKLFCGTQEGENKWKLRMIKAGLPELDFPDDWDTLSEGEKERRLDQIINLTLNVGKEA